MNASSPSLMPSTSPAPAALPVRFSAALAWLFTLAACAFSCLQASLHRVRSPDRYSLLAVRFCLSRYSLNPFPAILSAMTHPTAIAIIPARFGSTRLPAKALLSETGKPLIQHVVERARQAKTLSEIIVATDDRRIYDAVRAFGGRVEMTREHPNGTSRIAEVAERLPASAEADPLIINVQGDEPELEPEVIDTLVHAMASQSDAPMATLGSPFAPGEDPVNPNIVKIVVNQLGHAIYFSRSLVPYDRDAHLAGKPSTVQYVKHPGLYAYRRSFLLRYVTLPATPLEEAEKLEQLRAIEHGYRILVVPADVKRTGIDTPEQYAAFVQRQKEVMEG